ncbi:MAG: DNA polymerase III subunit epsilon [Aliidongia sp.]
MREVVLDTETTGLDPADGHRVVEVACVELFNLLPTGRELHFYCNPERDMPEEAMAVHGLSIEFLSDKPLFSDQAETFVKFMQGARLIAHNAEFDVRFLQAELKLCGRPALGCEVLDTLKLARRKFPGLPGQPRRAVPPLRHRLSERSKHGALIDTQLLAKVYLELMGGQQPDLGLAGDSAAAGLDAAVTTNRTARAPRPHAALESEFAAHKALIEGLKDPIWLKA